MEQANPFAGLAGMLGGADSQSAELAVGELTSVAPLRVRIGGVDYEAEDIRLCAHVTLPPTPGGMLVLVSFDAGQQFIVLGRC